METNWLADHINIIFYYYYFILLLNLLFRTYMGIFVRVIAFFYILYDYLISRKMSNTLT